MLPPLHQCVYMCGFLLFRLFEREVFEAMVSFRPQTTHISLYKAVFIHPLEVDFHSSSLKDLWAGFINVTVHHRNGHPFSYWMCLTWLIFVDWGKG